MKMITIEEHITHDEDLTKMMQSPDDESDRDRMKFFQEKATVDGKLTDIEEFRLPYMDNTGIDIQILSYINLASGMLECDERTNSCIRGNDFLKQQIDKHPDRFLGFTSLPLWDVEASCKELERCVKDYGFKGALVQGKFDGHLLMRKNFSQFFKKQLN